MSIIVVCPSCHKPNRIPAERLGDVAGRCGVCKGALFSGSPVDLDDATFDVVVNRTGQLVLIDFWAAWCGPCKMMGPQFAQAAQARPDVLMVKVDTMKAQGLAARFNIRSIPALVAMRGG
ncbi:thiol reductase thioredoxin, partial [Myxococcota bacterium]|nr:thiol reductase thioredoxin [Myxococcota bacterium]